MFIVGHPLWQMILFLARSLVDLHAILSVQGYNASLERYIISDTTKTTVIIFNSAADTDF